MVAGKHYSNLTGSVGVMSDYLTLSRVKFDSLNAAILLEHFVVVSSALCKQGAQLQQ